MLGSTKRGCFFLLLLVCWVCLFGWCSSLSLAGFFVARNFRLGFFFFSLSLHFFHSLVLESWCTSRVSYTVGGRLVFFFPFGGEAALAASFFQVFFCFTLLLLSCSSLETNTPLYVLPRGLISRLATRKKQKTKQRGSRPGRSPDNALTVVSPASDFR